MKHPSVLLSILLAAIAGCSSAPRATPEPTQPAHAVGTEAKPVVAKSRDGSFTGEVIGTLRPGSKFATLQIGMTMQEVQQALGRTPDRWHTYESGKRWIPFYFGNDARRMQALFKEEGCLVFTDGNVWGGAGGDLIQIYHDPTGACYQP